MMIGTLDETSAVVEIVCLRNCVCLIVLVCGAGKVRYA